jgi:hypothetical protein
MSFRVIQKIAIELMLNINKNDTKKVLKLFIENYG